MPATVWHASCLDTSCFQLFSISLPKRLKTTFLLKDENSGKQERIRTSARKKEEEATTGDGTMMHSMTRRKDKGYVLEIDTIRSKVRIKKGVVQSCY